jgi:cation transport regulator ChaC
MGKFLITEEEKSKILGMYYKTMGKSLVKEDIQDDQVKEFQDAGISQLTASEDGGDMNIQITDVNNRRINYTCMTDPRLKKSEVDGAPYLRAGAIYDGSFKDMKGRSSLTGNWEKVAQKYCKASYNFVNKWRADNCPKLSEKTHWNYANECKTYIESKRQEQVASAEAAKAPDTTLADAQKRNQDATQQLGNTNEQIRTMLADTQFLNPNKEVAQLETDVKKIGDFLITRTPTGDDAMALRNRIRVLLKYKPEYKLEPYSLSANF